MGKKQLRRWVWVLTVLAICWIGLPAQAAATSEVEVTLTAEENNDPTPDGIIELLVMWCENLWTD